MPRPRPASALTVLALGGASLLALEPPPAPKTPAPPPAMPSPVPPVARVAPADRNAAIKYLALAMEMPRDLTEKVAAVDYDACGVTLESIKNNPAAAAALAAIESYDVAPWINASRLAKYDLELATEEGFSLLLPHLGKLRSAARILRWSARVSLAQGSPAQAAERLAAIVRIARHASQDRILISSLVGVAMSAVAFDEMRTLAAGGTLAESSRTLLVETLESLDHVDPFLVRSSLRGERELAVQGTLGRFTGPDAGSKLVEAFLQGSDQDDATRLRAKIISEWDGRRIAIELDRFNDAFDALEEAWDSSEPKEVIERVEARVNADEFGPLAAIMIPATGRVHAASERAKKDRETTLATLRDAAIAQPSPSPR